MKQKHKKESKDDSARSPLLNKEILAQLWIQLQNNNLVAAANIITAFLFYFHCSAFLK